MYYEGNCEGKSKSNSKADVYPAFSSVCSSTVAIANPGLQRGEDDRNNTTAGWCSNRKSKYLKWESTRSCLMFKREVQRWKVYQKQYNGHRKVGTAMFALFASFYPRKKHRNQRKGNQRGSESITPTPWHPPYAMRFPRSLTAERIFKTVLLRSFLWLQGNLSALLSNIPLKMGRRVHGII